MLSYCLRVEKKKKNQKVKTRGLQKKRKRKPMPLSKCAVCNINKSRFI